MTPFILPPGTEGNTAIDKEELFTKVVCCPVTGSGSLIAKLLELAVSIIFIP